MATAKKQPAKKNAAPTPQQIMEAPAWNTIHIFGYGETQITGISHNGKIGNDELKALAPLLTSLAEKQQKGTKLKAENIHAINIFNNAFIDFLPKESPKNKSQRFAWSEVDTKYIDKFVKELMGKIPEDKSPTVIPAVKFPARPIDSITSMPKKSNRERKLSKIAVKK